MELIHCGRIIKGVGGLYQVKLLDNIPLPEGQDAQASIPCRAKGAFRHENITPLVGDIVSLEFEQAEAGARDAIALISDIAPRKNALIRPPMANLDTLFIMLACASPAPILPMIDKLICIAEHEP